MKTINKLGFVIFGLITVVTMFSAGSQTLAQSLGQEYFATPPFSTSAAPPLVMMVMGRNHKLYNAAYTDDTDLNQNGTLDIGYSNSIDYYGYFDSHKCYSYDSSNERFEPEKRTDDKKCPSTFTTNAPWSGNFLNYVTTSRIYAIRKVLYGGKRSTDTFDTTVLERAFIPKDAHSWGKEYNGADQEG